MKKEIELMSKRCETYAWLAEHDYFCKYSEPENEDETEESSAGDQTGPTHEELLHDDCEHFENCDTPDEGDSSGTETDTETDDSASNVSQTDLNNILRLRPWMSFNLLNKKDDCVPMSTYEEDEFFEKLEQRINSMPANEINTPLRLMYRKLKVRRLKSSRNFRVFNFDEYLKAYKARKHKEIRPNVLDRKKLFEISPELSQKILLSQAAYPDLSAVVSVYTNRCLKPFIWRDLSCKPPWLEVLNTIKNRNTDDLNSSVSCLQSDSIDYSYLKSEHIPALNSLCAEYFWPGIDVSDSLHHPDFSCVALYKKLIIGFALMVPDVTATETYITFLFTRPQWRGAGIATFMLYHLIQTCMGKDITLHVAADNPAVLLYQKFGFKVEQFIQNFYDKYLPISSRQCRHALFLRLTR